MHTNYDTFWIIWRGWQQMQALGMHLHLLNAHNCVRELLQLLFCRHSTSQPSCHRASVINIMFVFIFIIASVMNWLYYFYCTRFHVVHKSKHTNDVLFPSYSRLAIRPKSPHFYDSIHCAHVHRHCRRFDAWESSEWVLCVVFDTHTQNYD